MDSYCHVQPSKPGVGILGPKSDPNQLSTTINTATFDPSLWGRRNNRPTRFGNCLHIFSPHIIHPHPSTINVSNLYDSFDGSKIKVILVFLLESFHILPFVSHRPFHRPMHIHFKDNLGSSCVVLKNLFRSLSIQLDNPNSAYFDQLTSQHKQPGSF